MKNRLFSAALIVIIPASVAHAAITWSGDINPSDPPTWGLMTAVYIGQSSSATITVDNGSVLKSGYSYLGYNSGSTGTVTVTGTGSMWKADLETIYVGYHGEGTLNVDTGAYVQSRGCLLGLYAGSKGTTNITGHLDVFGGVTVGSSGSGTLRIEAVINRRPSRSPRRSSGFLRLSDH